MASTTLYRAFLAIKFYINEFFQILNLFSKFKTEKKKRKTRKLCGEEWGIFLKYLVNCLVEVHESSAISSLAYWPLVHKVAVSIAFPKSHLSNLFLEFFWLSLTVFWSSYSTSNISASLVLSDDLPYPFPVPLFFDASNPLRTSKLQRKKKKTIWTRTWSVLLFKKVGSLCMGFLPSILTENICIILWTFVFIVERGTYPQFWTSRLFLQMNRAREPI